jgi:hypothetical protein
MEALGKQEAFVFLMRFRLGLDAQGIISGDLRPRVLFLTL